MRKPGLRGSATDWGTLIFRRSGRSVHEVMTALPISTQEGTLVLKDGLEQERLSLRRVRIHVVEGADRGASIDVGTGSRVVGTGDDADLVLDDDFVSRRHLEIVPQTDTVKIRDLNSRNGTLYSGVRVHEISISESCVLQIGKTTLSIEIQAGSVELPLSSKTRFGPALGASPAMRGVFGLLEHAAQTDVTVLFEGPSGTGKDILATSLHAESARHQGPFVVVDCGSIPENLIESELFGHEKGAFTGASQARQGAFEQADGGTLFLDEIGELPLELQPRLLRALETRQFRRVGGSKTLSSNVRFVAATNRRLAELVRRGEFREDLYYRLNVVLVRVPPLAERKEDIPLLARKFLERVAGPEAEIPQALSRVLSSHDWPGNARELRNVVERFSTFGSADPRLLFGQEGLTLDARQEVAQPLSLSLLGADVDYHEAKRRIIDELHQSLLPRVLEECGGNVSDAAKKLGLPRTSLHRMLKKL